MAFTLNFLCVTRMHRQTSCRYHKHSIFIQRFSRWRFLGRALIAYRRLVENERLKFLCLFLRRCIFSSLSSVTRWNVVCSFNRKSCSFTRLIFAVVRRLALHFIALPLCLSGSVCFYLWVRFHQPTKTFIAFWCDTQQSVFSSFR